VAETPPLLDAETFAARSNGRVAASDPRVAPLLAGASAAIRRYCGWHIAPELVETDVILDSDGGDLLVLPTFKLREVISLELKRKSYTPPESPWESFSEEDDYDWSANGEIYMRSRKLPNRFRSVRISMRHGYDLDAIADLQQVIQQVVTNALASPSGATSESAGAMSVTWSQTAPGVSGGMSLLERDLAVVNLYRLPGRA